jgi:hypothetical protein
MYDALHLAWRPPNLRPARLAVCYQGRLCANASGDMGPDDENFGAGTTYRGLLKLALALLTT